MKKLAFILAALCLLLSCENEIPSPAAEDMDVSEEKFFTPGCTLVKFSEEMASMVEDALSRSSVVTKSSSLNEFVSSFGVISFERVFDEDPRFRERERREGLHLWYRVHFDPGTAPVTKAVADMSSIPGVELAEPVMKIRSLSMDDEHLGEQWYLGQDNGIDINVEGAWSLTTGRPEIIVAVVDGGIDLEHPDLKANVLKGGEGGSKNFTSGGYGITPDSHGTHVAGIIAASSNNGTGIAGIAGGDHAKGLSGVKLMSCQIFEGDSQGNAANAIKYGADNGAVISQNSWGYIADTDDDGKISAEEAAAALKMDIGSDLKVAVDYFIKYAGCDNDGNQLPGSPMKGGIVIFAAGNDALANGAPANYDKILAVGSVKSDGARSSFSNYGDWVDICAPGSNIYSTVPGGYQSMDGTSMACPMVSGVAALVLSYRGGLNFTNDMLWESLVKGASTDRASAHMVGPFLDAAGAVLYGDTSVPDPVESFTASSESNRICVSWNVTRGHDEHPAYGATLYASRDKASIESLDPRNPSSDVKMVHVETYDREIGSEVEAAISGLDFEEEYHVTVIPYNFGSKYAGSHSLRTVRTLKNNAPVIVADGDSDGLMLKSSQTVDIGFTITEPDGHTLTVEYEGGSDADSWISMKDSKYILRINGSRADKGTYTATVRATDEYGMSNAYPVTYTILENRAPKVLSEIDNLFFLEGDKGAELPLGDYFTDEDGDHLTYEIANSSTKSVHAVVSNGVLHVTPRSIGRAEITVTARDVRKLSVSQSFKVAVRSKDEPVSVYPTQVTDSFYISTGEDEAPVEVVVTSSGGKAVLDMKVTASAFTPAQVDMSDIAPGMYVVNVSYEGSEYRKNIVKL